MKLSGMCLQAKVFTWEGILKYPPPLLLPLEDPDRGNEVKVLLWNDFDLGPCVDFELDRELLVDYQGYYCFILFSICSKESRKTVSSPKCDSAVSS